MPYDISRAAGFPLALHETQLVFGDDVLVAETKTRVRGELAAFALDAAACVPVDAIQYWMYNGVSAGKDSSRLAQRGAQYELTLLSPRPLGAELSKTLGHIHNAPSQNNATFPEIYAVLYGAAYFLFYTLDAQKTRAPFCGFVRANAGEQIVMPPNTYHLTINAGASPLLFADVISKEARGLYDEVRATRGAPFYVLTDGTRLRNFAFVKTVPLVECPQLRAQADAPLYTEFVRDPDAFAWVNDPAMFWKKFPQAKMI